MGAMLGDPRRHLVVAGGGNGQVDGLAPAGRHQPFGKAALAGALAANDQHARGHDRLAACADSEQCTDAVVPWKTVIARLLLRPTDGRARGTRRPVSWLAGRSLIPRLPGFPVAMRTDSPLTVAGAAADSAGLTRPHRIPVSSPGLHVRREPTQGPRYGRAPTAGQGTSLVAHGLGARICHRAVSA